MNVAIREAEASAAYAISGMGLRDNYGSGQMGRDV